MSELRYIISDASKKVNVESHVLRYWEEELELDIPRNEMGHRYYRDQDINLLKTVKRLKDEGFQLKAIRMILPDINKIEALDTQSIILLREELNERTMELEENEEIKENISLITSEDSEIIEDETPQDKMTQFKSIMSDLISNALKENNCELSNTVSLAVTDNVIKEMDYLIRAKEEKEEERYKKLDETIRGYQKFRQESAITNEMNTKKKRKLFK